MSFYVKRNYTPIVLIICTVLGATSYYFVKKNQTEKGLKADRLATQAAQTKERQRKLAEQRKKHLAEKAAKAAKLAAVKQAKIEAQAKAETERKRLTQELADKLEAEMEKKQAERELAWKRYAGTKYPELKASGKNFKDVTVLTANSSGITFSYEHGARKYSYEDLPTEIQEICMYDPDFTSSYLAMQKKEKYLASKPPKKTRQKKQSTQTAKTTSAAQTKVKKKPPVAIKGNLTVRLVGSTTKNSRTFRSGSNYRSHYKTLQVTAVSSVPAKIYNNSSFFKSVPAMTKVTFTLQTASNGKYSLELRDNSGRVLDREAWNRKTGLGGSSGL